MKLTKPLILSLLFFPTVLFINSCMKDDMHPITEFSTGGPGVFIVCEGNFMYGNASLSYYDKIKKEAENTIFLKANGIPLGDVAQSMTIYGETAYIVVNNSGKIYAIDIDNFKYKGKITGLVSPRYIRFTSSAKAYISDIYSKSIKIINPDIFEITGSVNTDNNSGIISKHTSEQMVLYEDYMFVNSWSYDDMILVIDTQEDKLIDTIKVLPQPRKILLDKNNKLWVLCDGGFQGSDIFGNAGIVKINAENFSVEETFILGEESNPIDMQINAGGDTIYFINNHVYRFSVNDGSLPETEYINSEGRNLYALGIDPSNSDLYLADAVDFMQSGKIYRYNAGKVFVDSFNVGIIPNSFVFK